jgi:uncharacterized protein DUF397
MMDWLKSSRSGSTECVLGARLEDGGMAVKDSKNPDGPVLVFTRDEWQAFIEGVKLGEFD